VRDTVQCQVYRGRAVIRSGTRTSVEQASTTAAVDATREVVVRRAGATVRTEFSSSNGGWTTASTDNPARQDPYDGVDPRNTNHTWTTTFTATQAARAWPSVGTVRDITVLARTGDGQWGGRATSVRVTGSTGAVTVTGDQFRTALGLRSTWFTFVVRNLPAADDLLLTAGSRGVGSVEVLSYTAASGFTQRRTLTRTAVPEKSPRDWRFFYGSPTAGWQPDLIAVHANNTASGFVEVEVWSWASGYTVKTVDVVTPKKQFDPLGFTHVTTWERPDGSTDLAFFWTDRNDTDRVSVHVVSAASRYQQYSRSTLTGMTGRDDSTTGQYLVSRSGDFYQLRTRGTASGKTEVRVFRQNTTWSRPALTVATAIGWVDSTRFRYVLRDYDKDGTLDLVGVHLGRSDGPRIQVLPRRDGYLVQRYSRLMVGMPVTSIPFWQPFAR
jgi:SpoIID/LytB domain protein